MWNLQCVRDAGSGIGMKSKEGIAEGMTQAEVGAALGISALRVQQIEHVAIRRLWRVQVNEHLRTKKRHWRAQ